MSTNEAGEEPGNEPESMYTGVEPGREAGITFILCSCTLRELFSELSVSSVVCFWMRLSVSSRSRDSSSALPGAAESYGGGGGRRGRQSIMY